MARSSATLKNIHGLQSQVRGTWLASVKNQNECALLREVVQKVQSLKEQLSGTQTELASLQQQYSLSEKRLVRASKLISALGDEAGRWNNSADLLATRLQLLIGQTLCRAAMLAILCFGCTCFTACCQPHNTQR